MNSEHSSSQADEKTSFLSIVIPTYNERDNVGKLIELIGKRLPASETELIFVDDASPDGTANLLRELSRGKRHVRVIERWGRRGLASACSEGVQAAAGDYVLVMDADLQHDESLIGRMRSMLTSGECDVVSGSRFADESQLEGLSPLRKKLSEVANMLSRMVSGYALTDPMSGFFMFKRADFKEAFPKMSNIGYKVYFDFICSSGKKLNVKEVGFKFSEREEGESKLGILVLWQYLLLLLSKVTRGKLPPELIGFCIVGGSGVIVHMGIAAILFKMLGMDFGNATIIAISAAICTNYTLNNFLTYSDQRRKRLVSFVMGLVGFALICSLGATMNYFVANGLFVKGIRWELASITGILFSTFWNFALSKLGIWNRGS